VIFVSVGTQLRFDRLIQWTSLARSKFCPDQKAVVQKLDGKSFGLDCHHSFQSMEFEAHIRKCRFIVSHAGIGNIIAASENSKPILIVPRSSQFGEHRNDHQIATARNLQNMQGVYVAHDQKTFEEIFSKLNKGVHLQIPHQRSNQLGKCIKKYLQERFPS